MIPPLRLASPRIDGDWHHQSYPVSAYPRDLLLGIKLYGPKYRLQVTHYDVYQVLYVLDHGLYLQTPVATTLLTPGRGAIMRLGAAYTCWTPAGETRALSYAVRGLDDPALRGPVTWFEADATLRALAQLLQQHLTPPATMNLDLLAGLAQAFVAHAGRLPPGGEHYPSRQDDDRQLVERARRLLAATLHAGRGAPAILAGSGLSYRQLARLFVRHEGVTPKRYQLQARLTEAKMRLLDRRRSVTDIALELGFSSSQHFSRQFRQATGTTPLAYRRQHQPPR